MNPSFIPPRQVKIGDVAAIAGTTPRAIRHYHQIGLLPEPERGSDDRRRYGYGEMIRLLWIRKMADAGIALNDIRDAFADTAPAGADTDHDVTGILERLEETLEAQEAELQRQRTAVQRMRTRGSRMGLLSDLVASRLESLPEGSVRRADLDNLLVIERVFGPLGAALNATRYIALATHPGLQKESDLVDAAEEALDDTVAVDDPRVAQVAAKRHAFDGMLNAAIDDSGLAEADEALVDSWDALHPVDEKEVQKGRAPGSMSAFEVIGKMPYDFSPARLRCMELVDEMAARDSSAD
jgi:DNA-binding transcriptional MerR regulator